MGEESNRRHFRYPVDVPAVLRLPGVAGGIYIITVLDVSKSGVRVQCPRSLNIGTAVEIRCNNCEVFGEIRYARSVDKDGFHLGVEASRVKTRKGFEPEVDLIRLFPVRNV